MSKYWLFTSFNETFLGNHEAIFGELLQKDELTYGVYQIEECPETKRDHIQGYFVFKKRKRISSIKKLIGDNSLHLEKRRGNHSEAKEYCTKDESRKQGPYVFGDDESLRVSKKRKLEDVRERLMSGASEVDIADEFFGLWCRYSKAFQGYRALKQRPRDFKSEVRVYYGLSGTGKSRRATYEAGASAYRKPLGEWWDGYDGESNVIIDDFYGWLRFDELLRCLDRYSHRVPVKGGFVNFAPKLVIITSNVEPRQWYNEERINDLRFTALTRRLDVIEEMNEPWEEPIEDLVVE